MNPTTFDYSKPFTTVDGRKAEFVCDMLMAGIAVKAIKLTHTNGENSIGYYDSCGCAAFNGKTNSDLDLVNVPERRTVTFWVNVYPDETLSLHGSPEFALTDGEEDRIACLEITREYTVGEGV